MLLHLFAANTITASVIVVTATAICQYQSNHCCEDRLRNDLYCVGWALNSTLSLIHSAIWHRTGSH